jgi:hypothetical protein
MKIQLSKIDFSNFSANLDIQDIHIHDYSLPGLPAVYVVCYYPSLKQLSIYKATENGAESVYKMNSPYIPTAIYYPLEVTETENA